MSKNFAAFLINPEKIVASTLPLLAHVTHSSKIMSQFFFFSLEL